MLLQANFTRLISRPALRLTAHVVSPFAARLYASQKAHSCGIEAAGQGRVRGAPASAAAAAGLTPGASGGSTAGGQTKHGIQDRPAQVKAMEVEVKIRLPDAAAHAKVAAALAGSRGASFAQDNYFFDGPNRELTSQHVVVRLRLYDKTEKAVITIKGRQVLEHGIGRASEVEEDVEPKTTAPAFLEKPDLMLTQSPLIKTTAEKLGVSSLVCLGGFKNQRAEFKWEGHKLELDETQYEWGTLYEIECETDQPEVLRDKLEHFLKDQGVSYTYSATSKFANFVNRTLL